MTSYPETVLELIHIEELFFCTGKVEALQFAETRYVTTRSQKVPAHPACHLKEAAVGGGCIAR